MAVICCKTEVRPLDPKIAMGVLLVGMFRPIHWDQDRDVLEVLEMEDVPREWAREIPEEGGRVTVTLQGDTFSASLAPAVNSMATHAGKRITAGVYFEICAKYSEKVNGEIRQRATVEGCRPTGLDPNGLLLAAYPHMPMTWENICNGFKAELLAGHSHDDG